MKPGPSEWRRHNGDECPIKGQRGQRIQWRVIGTNQVKTVRVGQHDWTMTFEWRFA